MEKYSQNDPLEEWNRLERENAENAIVSSMFEAGLNSSAPVEAFTTWLLVGASAIAAFIITNAGAIIPFIERTQLLICGGFLCFSCLFGLISKIYALLCRIGIDTGKAMQKTFASHLDKYEKVEREIQENAVSRGITLQTGIRIERIMEQFYSILPKWVKWLSDRQINKYKGNPQIAYALLVKRFNMQALFALLQALSFLAFLVSGLIFAAQI